MEHGRGCKLSPYFLASQNPVPAGPRKRHLLVDPLRGSTRRQSMLFSTRSRLHNAAPGRGAHYIPFVQV